MIDQDSPAFVERRLNGKKKKKNSRSKNRITKKEKTEGNMHGFNLLNALARNRRTKRTHILFASISTCNRMHAYTYVYCHSFSVFCLAFSTSLFLRVVNQ